jgi:hypothetical protein
VTEEEDQRDVRVERSEGKEGDGGRKKDLGSESHYKFLFELLRRQRKV